MSFIFFSALLEIRKWARLNVTECKVFSVYGEDESGKVLGSKQSQTWVQVLSSLLMVCTLLYCGTQASANVEEEKKESEELVAKSEAEEEAEDVEDKESVSLEKARTQPIVNLSE